MAIKGKGRTKSRPAARAPRPTPVVRRPPFFARRWVQVLAALLVGMGIVTTVVWATNGLRATDATAEKDADAANARRAVQEWQTTVDSTLAKGVGSPGAGPGQITVLPSLTASVATLAKGDEDKKAGETAAAATTLVEDAVTTLGNVDLPKLIRDHPGIDVVLTNYLLNSKTRMVEGLQLYGRVAAQVEAAAEAEDPAVVAALIAAAEALLPIATRIFNEGYADYTESLSRAGLLQPTPGGLSPGSVIPGGG
jgi:hypothetical protein